MIALSVIVPTYNSGALAEKSAQSLDRALKKLGVKFEVLLVDDGSRSDELPRAFQIPRSARILALPRNRGKGATVRYGLAQATGRVRMFIDVDLPFDLSCLGEAYRLINEEGHAFVAADRSHPLKENLEATPWHRRLLSRIFGWWTSPGVFGAFQDTQCGFKAMSAEFCEGLLPLLKIERFAFDIELFHVAARNRIVIKRIPVRLNDFEFSSVKLISDGARLLIDLAKIAVFSATGRYASPELTELQATQYWRNEKTKRRLKS